jgi:hypothetical protein|tara:strand:- start:668 stop:859 length:192 start_codon:yes stop_codon:yes gene_type:complete
MDNIIKDLESEGRKLSRLETVEDFIWKLQSLHLLGSEIEQVWMLETLSRKIKELSILKREGLK